MRQKPPARCGLFRRRSICGISWSQHPVSPLEAHQTLQPPDATRLSVYRNARTNAQTAGDHPKYEIQPTWPCKAAERRRRRSAMAKFQPTKNVVRHCTALCPATCWPTSPNNQVLVRSQSRGHPLGLISNAQVLVPSQSRGHSLGLISNASYPHTSRVLGVLLGVLRSFARPRFPRLFDSCLVCRGGCRAWSSQHAISFWYLSHCWH